MKILNTKLMQETCIQYKAAAFLGNATSIVDTNLVHVVKR